MHISQWEEGLYSWKQPNKVFYQNYLLKSYFSSCKLLFDVASTAINYVSLSLWSLSKDLFTIQETAWSWFVLDKEWQPHQIECIL